jgi:hypothetical protein
VKSIFLWLATFIEDKQGSISAKRIGMFICLYILNKAVNQPVANEIAIYTIAALAFAFAGLTIPEWFSDLSLSKNKEKQP